MFKRIGLFLLTNIAILAVMMIVINLFGLNRFITANGLNYGTLFGFSSSSASPAASSPLAISKWMAKMAYASR